MRTKAPWALRYGVAVLAVVAAVAAMYVPVVGQGFASLVFLAVLVGAWYGGLGPGLLTTGLLAAVAVALLTSHYRAGLPAWRVASLLLFVAGGVLVTLMVEALHAARRRAEESRRWLSAVLTSIGDAVIAADPDGRVTFLNTVAEQLTGWSRDEAEGRPLRDIFRILGEETRRPADDPVGRVLRTGRIQGLANHTLLVSRDGAERPIDDSAAPIRDERGRLVGVVMVFRDVTERREDERERERLDRELREADRRKDEFLAMLAHELRNPLAAVANAARLSRRDGAREHVDWGLEVIDRQVAHLSRLIDDLLDVSRISRGKIELRRRPAAIPPILEAAVATVRPLIDGRGHALDVAIDRGELWAEVDPTRLEQVVANLLTNAAKYSEDGGRIRLSAAREGGDVVIAVEDAGVGIPPELLPRVFDLFAQGDRSPARSEGGLGVGLTIVKRLVELHGGSVAAESRGPGRGSRFAVRLPASGRPDEPGDVAAATPAAPARRSRILVVDDNADTARGLSRLLGLLGHLVEEAHSGAEAIEVARAHRPEFVLLDIGLPGMDGYEVASRLRLEECGRDAVIVALSGYGQDEDRRRSRDAGFDDHLVKPIDHDALLALLSGPRPRPPTAAVATQNAIS